MELQSNGQPENEEIDISEPVSSSEVVQIREPGSVGFEDSPDKKARQFAVYVLICAFVGASLSSEVYSFFKGNDKLLSDILSMFERVILLVLGYYFAKRE